MGDATLSQMNRLIELIRREEDPHAFVQSLNENWGKVRKIGHGQIEQRTFTIQPKGANPFGSERVFRDTYFNESISERLWNQTGRLIAELPGLDASKVEELAFSYRGRYQLADGFFVIPKPTVLAARLWISDPWDNFGLLTERGPFESLLRQRPFQKLKVQGQMWPDRYQLQESAKKALIMLEETQPGDVLVIPAQTGKLYVGYSIRSARWEIEHSEDHQWPLPSYVVGWILFTNPDRLKREDDLIIDCPGDRYSRRPGEALVFSLTFGITSGRKELHCEPQKWEHFRSGSGSASGFLP